MIPVSEVKMSGEDFDKLRKQIKHFEFQVDFHKDRAEKMDRFITKLLPLINYNINDAVDFIMDDRDYDIAISCGMSDKPTMHIQVKK